jgi:hypothetical protein
VDEATGGLTDEVDEATGGLTDEVDEATAGIKDEVVETTVVLVDERDEEPPAAFDEAIGTGDEALLDGAVVEVPPQLANRNAIAPIAKCGVRRVSRHIVAMRFNPCHCH